MNEELGGNKGQGQTKRPSGGRADEKKMKRKLADSQTKADAKTVKTKLKLKPKEKK